MRLRCRKCRKINDFVGDSHEAWVSRCAWCGANINIQFLSFAEMRRSEQILKWKEGKSK